MKIPAHAENITIEERPGRFVVLWRDAYGRGFREFGDEETARRFAAGEEIFFLPPQKGKKIPIVVGAPVPPQFERWTERKTREEILSAPLEGYHFGLREGTKVLAAVETCFCARWPRERTWVPSGTVLVIIPPGTRVEWYGSDEFRVVLTPDMQAYRLQAGWLKMDEPGLEPAGKPAPPENYPTAPGERARRRRKV